MRVGRATGCPIAESRRPKRMPLQAGAELSQRADLFSLAYRNDLREMREKGLTDGGVP
jgi:hypothetical protein